MDALVGLGGYDADLGARPMRRAIGRWIEAPLAAALLGGELRRDQRILAIGEGERVRFETVGGSVEAAE